MANLLDRCQRLWNDFLGRPPGPLLTRIVPVSGSKLVVGRDYWQVRIAELYLHDAVGWARTYDPLVVSISEFQYGEETALQALPTIVGPGLLARLGGQQEPQGTIYRNTRVAGLHPFNGGRICLGFVLCRVKRADLASTLLSILESTGQALQFAAEVTPYLKIGSVLLDGLDHLRSRGDVQPLAAFRREWDLDGGDWLGPMQIYLATQPAHGRVALDDKGHIVDDERGVPMVADRLMWTHDQLCYQWSDSLCYPYRASDFLVAELTATDARTDLALLPCWPPWKQVLDDAGHGTSEGLTIAQAGLTALYQQMLHSPDLTRRQATAQVLAWKAEMLESHDAGVALGTRPRVAGAETTVEKDLQRQALGLFKEPVSDVDCTIVVGLDGRVRYRDSDEREGEARVSDDRRLTELLQRSCEWLRKPVAEDVFETADLKLFGQFLCSYLLPEGSSARAELAKALKVADRKSSAVRVSLIFDGDIPASHWPWELLVVPVGDSSRFLCSHPQPSPQLTRTWPSWIARRLREPAAMPSPTWPDRPRVLLVLADPDQSYKLDAGDTYKELVRLRDSGAIDLVTDFDEPTLTSLKARLLEQRADVVHIIAHGDPDSIDLHRESSERRTRGNVRSVTPAELAGALVGAPALVYLDACRTAEKGSSSGFVCGLLEAAVPAVLAMQYEISNRDAQSFGKEFYRWAFVEPVDVAVNEARQLLGGKRKFAAPVLYLGGDPALRLARVRGSQVDCPSEPCARAGGKVEPTDRFCRRCGSQLAPCPRCGNVALTGATACRSCAAAAAASPDRFTAVAK